MRLRAIEIRLATPVLALGDLGEQLLAGEPPRLGDLALLEPRSVVSARAVKPSISEEGNGHGWLPR